MRWFSTVQVDSTRKDIIVLVPVDMTIVQKCSETTFLYKKWDDTPGTTKKKRADNPCSNNIGKTILER
jgi:hypothetical protein